MMKFKGPLLKLAAIALLLLACAPFLLIGQKSFTAYRANADEIVARGELYDRLRAIATFHKATPVENADAGELTQVLFGKGTPAVLSAGLQAKLREMAVPLGVDIVQVAELQPKTIANLQQIGVRMEMSGPLNGVHQLLQQVGTSTPWLFTGNVQMRSGDDQSFTSPTEPPLFLSVDIWGLAAVEPQKQATP